ncbi:hypothetical protein, partial [Falsarthrobacter nasiphocae]
NFSSRCPVYRMLPPEKQEHCRSTTPPLEPAGARPGSESGGDGSHSLACFYPASAEELAHSHQ